MSFTDRETLTVAVGLVVWLIACAWVLWRQGKDLGWLYDENVALKARVAHLESRVADVIDWAWESSPEERPEPEPVTEPLDVEPDTAVSHPADMYARKAHLLHRVRHIGQHRA